MDSGYIFIGAFVLVFFVLVPIVFALAYSQKGRRWSLRLSGNKIIKDWGIFSQNSFFGHDQTLRLLECERKGQRYYIIEESERMTTQGTLSVYMLKLNTDTITKLKQLKTEQI